MTVKFGYKIMVECDTCFETIEGEPRELWDPFWKRAKEEGWRSRRVRGDQWTHGCPKHEA